MTVEEILNRRVNTFLLLWFCSVLPKLPLHQRLSGHPITQPFFDLIKMTRSSLRSSVLPASPFPFLSSASQCVTSLCWTSQSLSSAHYHQVTSASWGCWQPAVSFLLMLSFLFPSSLMLSSPPMYLLLLFNTQLLFHSLPPRIWCFTCSFRFFPNAITSSFLALRVKSISCVQMEPHVFQFLPTACHWAALKRAWLPLLCTFSSDPCAHWWDFPEPFFLHTKQSQLPLLFLTGEMIQFLKKLLSFAGLAFLYVSFVQEKPELDPLQMWAD